MYLTPRGTPADPDVVMINALAKYLGLNLKIDNLAWTELIPGLEAKKFDVVSVGLDPTAARRKVCRSAVVTSPTGALAVPEKNTKPATVAAGTLPVRSSPPNWGRLTGPLLNDVPKTTVKAFPDAPTAIYNVATGRANAAHRQKLLDQRV